jgi:hypothetical protein
LYRRLLVVPIFLIISWSSQALAEESRQFGDCRFSFDLEFMVEHYTEAELKEYIEDCNYRLSRFQWRGRRAELNENRRILRAELIERRLGEDPNHGLYEVMQSLEDAGGLPISN